MRKIGRFISFLAVVCILLGLALVGVGLLTGGDAVRILYTTDIADMTKFFSREQIEQVVELFFKV